jgi:UTP--glucose-1-phosphate uridylyltransferase
MSLTSKPITRAVVACGGWSTRFLPACKVYNKALLPLLDRPVIDYLLAELAGAGLQEVALVHRPDDHSLVDYYQNCPRLEKYLRQKKQLNLLAGWFKLKKAFRRLEFISQSASLPYGSAAPLLAAQNFLGNEPFVYKYGDDLTLEPETGAHLARLIKTFTLNHALAAISGQKVTRSQIVRLGSLQLTPTGDLQHIEEKPVPRRGLSLLAHTSPFVFSPAVWPVLRHLQSHLSFPEFRLTDATNVLAQQGRVAVEIFQSARWLTTGDPQNWLAALNQLNRLNHS